MYDVRTEYAARDQYAHVHKQGSHNCDSYYFYYLYYLYYYFYYYYSVIIKPPLGVKEPTAGWQIIYYAVWSSNEQTCNLQILLRSHEKSNKKPWR